MELSKESMTNSFFGELDWQGEKVPVTFDKGEVDVEHLFQLAAPLIMHQAQWECELKKFLMQQFMAGKVRGLVPIGRRTCSSDVGSNAPPLPHSPANS